MQTNAIQRGPKHTQALPAGHQGQQSASLRALPVEWIERIFSRLATFYGNKFLDLWRGIDQNDVKQAWAEELGRFSGENIADALNELLKNKPFPPSLPEFIALCQESRNIRRNDKPTNTFVALPDHSTTNSDEATDARERCQATARRLGLMKLLPEVA